MNRWLQLLVVLAICATWVVAGLTWARLPEQIPTHFNFFNEPDHWENRGAAFWFTFPVLGTVFGALIGLFYPWLYVRLARSNSVWLGGPKGFSDLPEDVRVRAMVALTPWAAAMAIWMQALFVFCLLDTYAVATGRRQTLTVAVWLCLGGFVAIGIAAGIHQSRAMKKLLAGARAEKATA